MNKKLQLYLLISMCAMAETIQALDTMNNDFRSKRSHSIGWERRHKNRDLSNFNLTTTVSDINQQIADLSQQVTDIETTTQPKHHKAGGSYASSGPAGIERKNMIEQENQELKSTYTDLKQRIHELRDVIESLETQGDRKSVDRKEHKNQRLKQKIKGLNYKLKRLKHMIESIKKERVPLNTNGMVDAQMPAKMPTAPEACFAPEMNPHSMPMPIDTEMVAADNAGMSLNDNGMNDQSMATTAMEMDTEIHENSMN